jgi:hypothetical protein
MLELIGVLHAELSRASMLYSYRVRLIRSKIYRPSGPRLGNPAPDGDASSDAGMVAGMLPLRRAGESKQSPELFG